MSSRYLTLSERMLRLLLERATEDAWTAAHTGYPLHETVERNRERRMEEVAWSVERGTIVSKLGASRRKWRKQT